MSRSRRFLFPLPLLLAAALAVAVPAPAAPPSKEVRKTLPLPAGGRVEIDTYKGSLDLVAEERPDVAVEAKVTADPECGNAKDQAEWVEKTEIRIESSGKSVRIESDYSGLTGHHWGFLGSCTSRPFVDYRIRMPKKADLEVKDYKSKVAVAGLTGDLRLESYKGNLSVRELDGTIRLETYKGEAAVEFASLRGDSRFETYKGRIEVSLPKTTGFELDADIGRRGDFKSEFGSAARSAGHLRTSLNGGGPRLALSTHKGTLKVAAR
jgi:hypothetical protein